MPPAPSLFCEHKRLRSVCPLCGSARAGAATPMRGPVTHDVDDTIHRFRGECHARLRGYLTLVHEGAAPSDAYAKTYDPWPRRGRHTSDEEDPASFRGGFYRAMVKLFDITVDDRRIQGYNGLTDWDEMRDFVFRKFSPEALDAALREKRVLVHGGNGAWPRQQITSDLVRHDRVQEAVLYVAFGSKGETPERATEEEIIKRLARVEQIAAELRIKPGTIPLASKVLHVFAPKRWPALTPRTTPEVGEELSMPIPAVDTPEDYVRRFAPAMRDIMASRKHVDLDHTDILVADTWLGIHGDDGEEESADLRDAGRRDFDADEG